MLKKLIIKRNFAICLVLMIFRFCEKKDDKKKLIIKRNFAICLVLTKYLDFAKKKG